MRKAKSRAERHASYQKPALRSEAFARALSEAKLCVAGSGGLRPLFEQAARKAASLPKQPFRENWAYVQTMLRLVRAYERGEYQQISNVVDDATVIEFVADKARQALDDFMTWETAPPSG